MRRAAVLLSALSIAAAGSCARAPDAVPALAPAAASQDRSGGAAWSAGAEDGLAWFFNPASDGLKLAYGAPNSDAVRLMIYCQGDGGLRVETTTTAAQHPDGDWLTLTSGNAQDVTRAASEPNMMGGGRLVSVTLGRDAESIAAFRRTGVLTLNGPGGPLPLHGGPEDAPAVRSFFEACR